MFALKTEKFRRKSKRKKISKEICIGQYAWVPCGRCPMNHWDVHFRQEAQAATLQDTELFVE